MVYYYGEKNCVKKRDTYSIHKTTNTKDWEKKNIKWELCKSFFEIRLTKITHLNDLPKPIQYQYKLYNKINQSNQNIVMRY